MKLKSIDLHLELQRAKSKAVKPDLLEEVKSIIESEIQLEEAIIQRIQGRGEPQLSIDKFEQDEVYGLNQIRTLCLKYRLRFLDSKLFKGEIPHEAILKIKALEKQVGLRFKAFKIVAPKELFMLSDKDSDPLLFVQLSDDKFYFIHKWGGEINPFRAILARPMRNFMSLFWSLAIVALLFSLAIPTSSIYIFVFLLVHSFIAICGLACLLIFTYRENFSETEWDSKFLS